MKNCVNCGKEIADDVVFCPFCGQKQDKVERNEEIQPETTKKGSNFVKIGIAAAVIVLIAIAAVVFVQRTMPVTINLEDYFEITIDGYDGFGTADVSFDDSGFTDDVIAALEKKNDVDDEDVDDEEAFAYDLLTKIFSAWQYTLTPKEQLSNGDEVVLSFTCNNEDIKEYKIQFKGADIKKTVKDLPEITSFDPFEGLQVTYSGTQPRGRVEINQPDNSYGITYIAEPEDGLSNGDTVSITAYWGSGLRSDFNKDFAEKYGAMPSRTQENYTVEGLDAYASAVSDISDEMMAKMQATCEDLIAAEYAEYQANSTKNTYKYQASFIGNYFLTAKDNSNALHNNVVYLIYQIDDTSIMENDIFSDTTEEISLTYYKQFAFYDVINLSDGTCSADLSKYGSDYKWIYGNSFRNTVGNKNYTYYGFKTLDALFNKYVTAERDNYTYESTVNN